MYCIAICNINGWLLYPHEANQLSTPKSKQLNTLKVIHSFIKEKKPVDRSIYCLKKGLSDINVTVMPKSGRQTDISTTLKKEKKWGIVCLICMNC